MGVDFSDLEKTLVSISNQIDTKKENSMQLAFVSSKYKGDVETNRKKAVEYANIAIEMGFIPIAPHTWLPELLDDNDSEQRKKAQEMCLELVKRCDVFMQCGDMPDGSFMVEELAQAIKSGKPKLRIV